MPEDAQQPADEAPYLRLLSIKRFRGIEDLTWLRTLADRLVIQDKSLAAILTATDDVRRLIVGAACGSLPADPDAPNDQKKEWKKHGQRWFKSTAGGAELAEKMFALGLWPKLSPQLLPFVNAVRTAVGLAAVQTVN